MSLCHSVIIGENNKFNAASPDELALLNAAKQFGHEFKSKDEKNIMKIFHNNKYIEYELHHICEFSSARKRMSVVVEDKQTNVIKVMTKGADSIIADLLSESSKSSDVYQKSQKFVNEYATEGLRTLFLAERVVPKKEFYEWIKGVREAQNAIYNREELVAAEDEKLEKNLELIGSTAIEDKL